MQVIEELEKIDDDCDKHGIQFVKIDDAGAAKEHGVKNVRKFIFKNSQFFNSDPKLLFKCPLVPNNHLLREEGTKQILRRFNG